MKLRNKVSGVFFAIDEKTKQNKKVDKEQLSYYSMNSHCPATVS